jgi:phosphoribosylaminoimidazole-succinocarboxamide synthase
MTLSYQKGKQIYEGKAKIAYAIEGHDDLVWFEYKNSLTAFNAQKKGDFAGKGKVNRDIATIIFRYLKNEGIDSHWIEDIGETETVTRKLQIIPLEVVVRNVLAGSTAKKFGIEEGRALKKPLVEFYYKDDALGDPFISDDQALMLEAATQTEMDELKRQALAVNEKLIPFFQKVGLRLVDFKLEFGKQKDGKIMLADEITPDTCRLWDSESGEKMDKDRFRRDLGGVKESYEKVLQLLEDNWGKLS